MLRERRRQLNLTVSELANAVGMSQPALTLIEKRKRIPPEIVPYVTDLAACLKLAPVDAAYREFIEAAHAERFGKKMELVGAKFLTDFGKAGMLEGISVMPSTLEGVPLEPVGASAPNPWLLNHPPKTPWISKIAAIATSFVEMSGDVQILRFVYRAGTVFAEVRTPDGEFLVSISRAKKTGKEQR